MRKTACIIAAVILFSSCASIVSQSSSTFGVDTTPQGANVEILNRKGEIVYRGQTPVTTRLRHSSGFFRRASYRIKLSMDGYAPKLVTVDAHVNGWYWGNILLGGVLGMLIIDPATGAMYKLDEIMVDEKLVPANATGAVFGQEPQDLKILALKDIPAQWRGRLVKLP